MYKDIITYELAEGVTEEQLLSVGQQIVNDWMKNLKGFVSWEIHRSESGYTDIVTWETKEDAKNAEQEMVKIPNAGAWYACYKEGSISSTNLTRIAEF